MPQAFAGVRILDFSQVLSGPVASVQLALLGAEVIKIEQPGTGDQMRRTLNVGPDRGMSPSFLGMNVNKKSVTLNLREPAAIDIIRKLIERSDVLLENFKAGTMSRYGLGYDEVKAIKPNIIYCSLTGYGQEGPMAGAAAYDSAIQASSGMMSQTGHPETGPTRTGYMQVDMSTGLNTAFAISAALYRKVTTGLGQRLDVAMMDTAIFLQAAQYNNYLNQGVLGGLMGNNSQTGLPTANIFPTADGNIQISAVQQSQVEKLFKVLGRMEDLKRDEFVSSDARKQYPDVVHEVIVAALATNTTDYWLKTLVDSGVPVAKVRNIPEVLKDPQFKSREVFATMPSPVDKNETITVVKAGYKTDVDGPSVRQAAPLLGEHTEQVLTELGYSESDISRWGQSGVI